jgi:hypothetical protein
LVGTAFGIGDEILFYDFGIVELKISLALGW